MIKKMPPSHIRKSISEYIFLFFPRFNQACFIFIWKYIKIIYIFLFLKFIFNINTLKYLKLKNNNLKLKKLNFFQKHN